ncbi:MAG TPA: hypothetical protein VMD99_02065 [Terriglobales bacterium]|nr:hypothetical protein [Terriglobales bacterium]
MAMIDPEQERRRLAQFYSGQMDGELEKVAGQAYELTELARGALRAELAKRGLTPPFIEVPPVIVKEIPQPQPGNPPLDEPPTDEPSHDEPPEEIADGHFELRQMVMIRRFRDLPEALLAKGSLDSAGIRSVLVDENLVRLDWFWSNLMGGVKLEVDAEDAESADEILSQPIPEGFDAAGTGEYLQPRCPNCQSLDVSFQELNKPVAYVSAYLGLPLPLRRRAWRCHSCNVEWEDDGVDGPSESAG